MTQVTKTIKAATCTCLLLYIVTVLDILKKKPPERLHFNESKPEFSELKTLVGYSVEYQIAQDLTEVIYCQLNFSDVVTSATQNSSVQSNEELYLKEDSGIFLLKSYFDKRLHPYTYVRTIALLPENTTIFCQISSATGKTVTRRATTIKIWAKSWEKPKLYTPSLISCLAPETITRPAVISFVREPCSKPTHISQIQENSYVNENPLEIKTIVCVKPLNFRKDVSKQLIEWIKLNAVLGASRIFIYYLYLPRETIRNLKPFIVSNLVELTRFRVPKNIKVGDILSEKIWFKRKLEILAYNDCFYKNLHTTDFVIPLDVDEVIVPKKDQNWSMMFKNFFRTRSELDWKNFVQNFSSFSVRNAYFFKKFPFKAKYVLPFKLPALKNESLHFNLVRRKEYSCFSRNLRSFSYSPNTESAKSFISVNGSLTIFNHFPLHQLKPGYRQMLFPTNVAQLNHYRDSCDPLLIDNCELFLNHVAFDNSLQRFRDLIKSS